LNIENTENVRISLGVYTIKWSQRLAVNIIDLRNVGNRKFSRKYTSPRSCGSVLNVSFGFRCSRADTLRVSVKLAGYLAWNLRNSILVSLPLIHSHLAFHHFLLVMLAFSIEMYHARVFVLTGCANCGTQSPTNNHHQGDYHSQLDGIVEVRLLQFVWPNAHATRFRPTRPVCIVCSLPTEPDFTKKSVKSTVYNVNRS
jgi:hypothetical protein